MKTIVIDQLTINLTIDAKAEARMSLYSANQILGIQKIFVLPIILIKKYSVCLLTRLHSPVGLLLKL